MKDQQPLLAMDDHMSTQNDFFLTIDQAKEKMSAAITPIHAFERLNIRHALNRVLCEDVIATFATPPYDNSGMDGYAFRSADVTSQQSINLNIIGTSLAGHPFDGEVKAGQAVRIMTGAQVPMGADTVVMQEDTEKPDEKTVVINKIPAVDANIRHIGDDLNSGETILKAGKKLSPTDLAYLASQGVAEVTVVRKVRVAFFSTGDELRSIGEILEEGQIYDSNRYSLFGLLSNMGLDIIDMGVIKDDRQAIENAFLDAADNADVVITSGGVSVGDADYVKETLDKLGAIDFWKISMKPGKPLAFGLINDSLFFGLPGNPVSVIATFYQVVQPAIQKLTSQDTQAPLIVKATTTDFLKKRPGRTDFQRGILTNDKDGELVVKMAGTQASHILTSMSHANCFIVLDKEQGNVEIGETVKVQPFYGLLS